MTHSIAIAQNHNLVHTNWYEFPKQDRSVLEVWCYTDRLSYVPGETVHFHLNTTAESLTLRVYRDGPTPQTVYEQSNVPGSWHPTPADCSVAGCNWPSGLQWTIPEQTASGCYVVETAVTAADGASALHHHLFIVRSGAGQTPKPVLLLCATNTWIAYNNWGGSSHYEGNVNGDNDNVMSPVLSTQRPWAKGQVWVPVGAPRIASETNADPGAIPRYPYREWAYLRGFAKYYAESGWAMYERNFAVWAEQNGYEMDYAVQHDIHYGDIQLDDYACVVVVGHDEYWTREMRRAVDRYVEAGGNVARFAGNFLWQIRLEEGGQRQVCYKYWAHENDPFADTDPALLTSAWEDPAVGWPGAETFGLNALRGLYVGFGAFCPRHAMGFTVYRPEHWAFANTDAYFGDTIGAAAKVFSFEVDGLDFTFKGGLPYPTFEDGAPPSLEILAMAPASKLEEDHGNPGTYLCVDDNDAVFIDSIQPDGPDSDKPISRRYGAGMIACFERGSGTVFNAGTCEWVNGLRLGDRCIGQMTRNVLDRFGARSGRHGDGNVE